MTEESWNMFVLKIFDAWWANHGDTTLRIGDLASDILKLMPIVSRQYAARFLARHANRRVGNYHLESKPAADKWGRPSAQYRLVRHSADA